MMQYFNPSDLDIVFCRLYLVENILGGSFDGCNFTYLHFLVIWLFLLQIYLNRLNYGIIKTSDTDFPFIYLYRHFYKKIRNGLSVVFRLLVFISDLFANWRLYIALRLIVFIPYLFKCFNLESYSITNFRFPLVWMIS